MNNDALVAALGVDAVAAVRGYRLDVVAEAARRGLRLVSDAPSELVATGDAYVVIDPIDIRLHILDDPGNGDLGGGMLSWSPAHGWALSRSAALPPLAYYAGPDAGPMHLVPTAPQVLEWVTGEPDGPASPPVGVELDDDPAAIQRLLEFANPKYQTFLHDTFAGCTPEQVRVRLLHRSPLAERAKHPHRCEQGEEEATWT
jgi:hypothetical protein